MKDLFAPVKSVSICHVYHHSSIDFQSLGVDSLHRIDCGCVGLLNQVERICTIGIGYV